MKFLGTAFLQNTPGRLLLKKDKKKFSEDKTTQQTITFWNLRWMNWVSSSIYSNLAIKTLDKWCWSICIANCEHIQFNNRCLNLVFLLFTLSIFCASRVRNLHWGSYWNYYSMISKLNTIFQNADGIVQIFFIYPYLFVRITLHEKCPNTEFFLVRFFLYWDWIRKFTE